MSNLNVPDYGMIWGAQLVTADEMNIQLNQLSNQITYMTDLLTPCILYGCDLSGEGTSTLTVSAGVCRGPDYTLGEISVYNTVPGFFKVELQNIDVSLFTNGIWYIYARYIPTATSDGNFVEFDSEIFYTQSIGAPTNAVSLGTIGILSGAIPASSVPGISYSSFTASSAFVARSPDFRVILANNQYAQLKSIASYSLPFVDSGINNDLIIRNYIISSLGLPTSIGLVSLNGTTNGTAFDYQTYTITNNYTSAATLTGSSCTIGGSSTYSLAAGSTAILRFDSITNNWLIS